jgi:hypothetical protein
MTSEMLSGEEIQSNGQIPSEIGIASTVNGDPKQVV